MLLSELQDAFDVMTKDSVCVFLITKYSFYGGLYVQDEWPFLLSKRESKPI